MMQPRKDGGFIPYLVSNKIRAVLVFAIGCIALYLVKESLGILWSAPHTLRLDLTWQKMSLSTAEFFSVNGDVSRITWAHAVNTREYLHTAMKNETMMLEADVQIGSVKDIQHGVAIMAHPPDTTSDLSLLEFLTTMRHSQKGIKLDFKSIEAADAGFKILSSMREEIKIPVWINSDVVQGTSASPTHVDKDRFFKLINDYKLNFTVSLGWSLGIPTDTYKGGYDWPMVKAMAELVEKYQVWQPVTFAVEATYARMSLKELQWLVDQTKGTITIWFHPKTMASVKDIRCIVETFGKTKTFLDIPSKVRSQMYDAASGSSC